MERNSLDMVVLAILNVTDCSGYTLNYILRLTLNEPQVNSSHVFLSIRRLTEAGYVAAYNYPHTEKRLYASTREGKSKFIEMLEKEEYSPSETAELAFSHTDISFVGDVSV